MHPGLKSRIQEINHKEKSSFCGAEIVEKIEKLTLLEASNSRRPLKISSALRRRRYDGRSDAGRRRPVVEEKTELPSS